MKDTVHWLNFLSAALGFVSVLVLAVATIGEARFESGLKRAETAHDQAGTPNDTGVPPVVIIVGLAFLLTLGIFLVVNPEAFWSMLTLRGIGLLFLVLGVGSWLGAVVLLAVVGFAIEFAKGLKWAEDRKIAGAVGFILVSVSFVLLIVSTGIDLFYVAPGG